MPTDASERDALLAAVNADRAELGLDPLVAGLFGRLSSEFLSRKAKGQLRNVKGEFQEERARLDVGRKPFWRRGRDEGLSESGQELVARLGHKKDADGAGPDWKGEPIGKGASEPYLYENTAGEKFVVKDRGGGPWIGAVDFGPEALEKEVAAYELLKAMGSKSVPAVARNDQVSVTEFAGSRDGLDTLEDFHSFRKAGGDALDALPGQLADPQEILRVALADVAMANADRHYGNMLVGRSGDTAHLYPIDHNMVLSVIGSERVRNGKYERYLWSAPVAETIPPYIEQLARQGNSPDQIRAILTQQLRQMQADGVRNLRGKRGQSIRGMRRNLRSLDIDKIVDMLMQGPPDEDW